MEVILLEPIAKLGHIGDVVRVKSGYARNCLLPKGLAARATHANMEEIEARRAEFEKRAAEHHAAAEARASKLNGMEVSIAAQAGEEGKLFGSVGTREISEAITAAGQEVVKSEIQLPEGVIRLVGEYDIDVRVHSDVTATVKVKVTPEE